MIIRSSVGGRGWELSAEALRAEEDGRLLEKREPGGGGERLDFRVRYGGAY